MPTQRNGKIITNRQLNFTLGPVDTYNQKDMPHRLPNFEIDGTWNHHQSKILDVLLDRIVFGTYNQTRKFPKSWRTREVIETINRIFGGYVTPDGIEHINLSPRQAYIKQSGYDVIGSLKEKYEEYQAREMVDINFEHFVKRNFDHSREYQDFIRGRERLEEFFFMDALFSINVRRLLEDYQFLEQYRYSLIKYTKSISQASFRMNYKVKYIKKIPEYNDEGKRIDEGLLIDLFYRMGEFQKIVEVDADKESIKLNFNTPLGKLMLYNTLMLDTDWCPQEAFRLSKNAYFLYKRFVLNKRSGRNKSKRIPLGLDELKSFLDLKWSNDRGVHQIIMKALNDMVENDLVDSLEWNKNAAKKRTYLLLWK